MKLVGFGFLLVLTTPVQAEETWQKCFDQGDFSFNADTFVKSNRVSKAGCLMRFVELGGKGTKLEINLCDSSIHIDEFEALDSTKYTRHYAGSSGCPSPSFGADFELEPTQKGGVGFGAAKEKVKGIYQRVKEIMGPNTTAADAEKYKNTANFGSEAKLACAELLLNEYVDKCAAFEAPAKIEALDTKALEKIPGVRPQTIKP